MQPNGSGTGGGPGPLIIDDSERGLFKVHRSTMTSPDVLQRERDAIFEHSWLYLGHDSELRQPGDFVTRTVAGRPLIFTRDGTGRVRAFLNTCPHRGAEVCREDQG
ncbi:MAG: aromatic ring-hydroxylating oxygenase subunit alpha, partial [Acidimicrobiia bacterium]